jgi:hypothetical protein
VSALWSGDRVDVVLDCVTDVRDGRVMARVFVRLIDAPAGEGGSLPPPVFPDGQRNVVSRWLGRADDQTGFAAFGIDCGPVDES